MHGLLWRFITAVIFMLALLASALVIKVGTAAKCQVLYEYELNQTSFCIYSIVGDKLRFHHYISVKLDLAVYSSCIDFWWSRRHAHEKNVPDSPLLRQKLDQKCYRKGKSAWQLGCLRQNHVNTRSVWDSKGPTALKALILLTVAKKVELLTVIISLSVSIDRIQIIQYSYSIIIISEFIFNLSGERAL